MTGNETHFAAAIKYVRPFDPEKLVKYVWKQSNNNKYVNASAPCFYGDSIEERFYCKDHFSRDAMATMGETEEVWFEQLIMLLHGLAKDIWLEVLDNGDPEDNGQPFDDEDEDGFIKAMEQYILQFCPQQNVKTCQLRSMGNFDFRFKRGTEVAAHMTRFRHILNYTGRLPDSDMLQPFNSKIIIFDSFPKAWKESFLNKDTGNFDTCKLMDILQHMDQAAATAANNDEKNKKDNKKQDNGRRGGQG